MIIFDLDDTLIDTSGSITPKVLENAMCAMQQEGLYLPDPQKALKQLLSINSQSISSDVALKEFIKMAKAPDIFYKIARKEVYESPTLPKTIQPIEGASELLEKLSDAHTLALVTKGVPEIQKEKMRKASIDKNLFRYIFCCEQQNKKQIYQKIGKNAEILPKNSLVCGDRIYFDLTPAKELGFKTVQIVRGRGLGNTGLKNDVDYTILHLRELSNILEKFQSEVCV